MWREQEPEEETRNGDAQRPASPTKIKHGVVVYAWSGHDKATYHIQAPIGIFVVFHPRISNSIAELLVFGLVLIQVVW